MKTMKVNDNGDVVNVTNWTRGSACDDDLVLDIGYRFLTAEEAEHAIGELQNSLGVPLLLRYDGVNHLTVIEHDDAERVIRTTGSDFDAINSPYHYISCFYIAGFAQQLDQVLVRYGQMRKTAEPKERKLMITQGRIWPYWNIAVQDLSDHDEDWVFQHPDF